MTKTQADSRKRLWKEYEKLAEKQDECYLPESRLLNPHKQKLWEELQILRLKVLEEFSLYI